MITAARMGIAVAVTLITFIFVVPASQADLIGEWNFNEGSGSDVNDSIGARTGQINGATWADGLLGSGLYFNGVSNVNFGGAGGMPGTSFTISLWFQPDQDEDLGTLIHWGTNGGNQLVSLDYGPAYWGLSLGFYANDLHAGLPGDISGVWNHVAATYDAGVSGANRKIYLNGTLVGWDETHALSVGTSSFLIGNRESGFDGLIDEVRIYDNALTAGEIADLAAPVPEPATMLLLGSGLVGLTGFRRKYKKT